VPLSLLCSWSLRRIDHAHRREEWRSGHEAHCPSQVSLRRGCCGIVGSNHHIERPAAYGCFMVRPRRQPPKRHSADWPEAPCEDVSAEVARRLAVRLRGSLGDRSLRWAKARTGVDHSTIADIISGNTWPDAATIARLEDGLASDLWPGRVTTRRADGR